MKKLTMIRTDKKIEGTPSLHIDTTYGPHGEIEIFKFTDREGNRSYFWGLFSENDLKWWLFKNGLSNIRRAINNFEKDHSLRSLRSGYYVFV